MDDARVTRIHHQFNELGAAFSYPRDESDRPALNGEAGDNLMREFFNRVDTLHHDFQDALDDLDEEYEEFQEADARMGDPNP